MKKLGLLFFSSLQLTIWAQTPTLYGLIRTSNPVGVKLGTLDLMSGNFSALGSSNVASVTNLTGAALDLNTNHYFFLSQGGTNGTALTVGMNDGILYNQVPLTNPIAPSSFNNFRFNTSDSTLYGLAGRYIPGAGPGQGTGELYFASMDPLTGIITQISPQSILDAYSLSGSAIDPHQMLYYFSKGTQFYGIDMYNGQVYTSQTLSFPEGGSNFGNYTYNCADTTIYGIIGVNTTPPLTAYLGKIDAATGVVTRISQTPLQYPMYSVNGSSTIDPATGIYYYVTSTPPNGVAVVGISLATGALVSMHPVSLSGVSTYFDLIRHPSDCYAAEPVRPSTIDGGAGLVTTFLSQTKVYPNPILDQLQIESEQVIKAYALRDAQGKIIIEGQGKNKLIQLSLGQIPNGVYFLEIQTESGIESVKLVK